MAAALGPPEVIAQLENAAKVLMVSPPRRSQPATAGFPAAAVLARPDALGRLPGRSGRRDLEVVVAWRSAARRRPPRPIPARRPRPPVRPCLSSSGARPERGTGARGSRSGAPGPWDPTTCSAPRGLGLEAGREPRGLARRLRLALLRSDPVLEPREAPARGLLSPSDALLVPGALGSLPESGPLGDEAAGGSTWEPRRERTPGQGHRGSESWSRCPPPPGASLGAEFWGTRALLRRLCRAHPENSEVAPGV